jgi:carbamate kinase
VIELQLRNVLKENDMDRDIISLITRVIVSKDDPAFDNPQKPIGPFYSKEEAENIAKETNSNFVEDPRGRGLRKVVASPRPLVIQNTRTIEKIAREGHIVIAVGGGGIPVFFKKSNYLEGIEAVIDKDLASALMATQIRADKFFILTDVPKVCLHFNTPQEKTIDRMSITEARKYLEQGHFAEGSMAPKIRAAVNFVEYTGNDAIITQTTRLGIDDGGTRVTMI